MDSVGEGEGGKIWENGIETCKISSMKKKKYISKTYQQNLVKFLISNLKNGLHLEMIVFQIYSVK